MALPMGLYGMVHRGRGSFVNIVPSFPKVGYIKGTMKVMFPKWFVPPLVPLCVVPTKIGEIQK